MKALDELCKATGTRAEGWEFLDGPDSGCGVDYWLKHKPTGKEAYVNDDQGHVIVDVTWRAKPSSTKPRQPPAP